MEFRFLNTWEPVVPLYRRLFPALAARDHTVEAWLARTPYRSGELAYPNEPGIRYQELPTGARAMPAGLRKRLVHAGWGTSVALHSLFGKGTDLNVFLTQPPLFQSWGRVLAALRGQPYALIVMDLYPWVAIEAGVLPRTGWATRRLINLARGALLGARRVFAIGRCMEARLLEIGVAPERIVLVHNWVDHEVIQPLPRDENPLRERLGLGDRFVLMYSGNLGVSHVFDELIEVLKRFRDRDDVAFVVAGQGSRRQQLEQAAEANGLHNLHLLDYQPADQLGASLSLGDAHFVCVREGFDGLVVPSKAYGVFAAGRPMIYLGDPAGEISRLVTEHDLGISIVPGDADALADAIETLRADPARGVAQGQRARVLIEGELNRSEMIRRYFEALEVAAR